MRTKTIKYYTDLPNGWQDWDGYIPYLNQSTSAGEKQAGSLRVEVIVSFPRFGGMEDTDTAVKGTVEPFADNG